MDRMMKLPAKLRQGPILVFSRTSVFYYALYLPEAETAKDRHQIADEKATLAYDESEASYYWGLNVSVDMLPNKNVSEIEDYRKVCHDAIKDWAPEFHKMIDVTDDESGNADMIVTQVHASTEPKADWRTRAHKTGKDKGHARVWVMGDAMHAMQPNRGQGGNQALADCADMLPQLLHLNSLASISPARPTQEDVEVACEKYEKKMIRRAFSWVKKSGGTNFPTISLDGVLGIVVHLVAKLVMPLLKLYLTIFPQKSEE
jgi:2-polyprenyl-6-methoxyphenol hydroxylase-like FAD-dependent oxidoreductase